MHKIILDILGNNWPLVLVCIVLQEMDKMLDFIQQKNKYQYFAILMDLPITLEMWITDVPFTVFCKAGMHDPHLFR